jgi:ABC-type multidrug transport system fused ATPase/permease subunit
LTQDPSVFDGTIHENLVYSLDEIPEDAILHKVIIAAKCEFIREFKKGLQTEIGERGVKLSGGQKQRLAIAKVMLKNPNIIFLDEPTSALDSFNEEQINDALHNLFKRKTVIIVAHRLQTVKQADKILLFENGKIVEKGTHTELVRLKGKYKRMLDLQSGF